MTPLTHEEQRLQRLAYREEARKLYEHEWQGQKVIKVPVHAHVQVVEDGAFVECVVWVPREAL